MSTEQIKQDVIEALMLVKDGKVVPNYGLCRYLACEVGIYLDHSAFKKWEFFSGCDSFPVPSSIGMKSSYEESLDHYVKSLRSNNLYDINNEYGKLRLMLVDHLLEGLNSGSLDVIFTVSEDYTFYELVCKDHLTSYYKAL